jgi:hypothetical protein
MAGLCPFFLIAASGSNPRGGPTCQEAECALWVGASHIIRVNHPNISYKAGCGLMPKENRTI